MTVITDYAFGRMTIGNQVYTKDLIIMPGGRIKENWFRKSGHLLTEIDLEQVLQASPGLIIAGTGAYGRMKIAAGLDASLERMGIKLVAMETAQAVERFNAEHQNSPDLCGCFHLTC